MPETTIDRSCGPSECQTDWLASARLEVDEDAVAFTKLATDAGWGDGLPLVPPTEERVRSHVAASGRYPDVLLRREGVHHPSIGAPEDEKWQKN